VQAAVAIVVASLVAAGMLYQWVGVRRDARAYEPPGAMVDVGGHRLHAICHSSGSPPVVFESGIAASSLSWTRVMPQVAAFTRACAYDRAGLAWSDAPREARTVARMVGELDRLLEHVGGGPYVLVGHSFGAFLICLYASRAPNVIAGLVLLDPPSEWQPLTRERARLVRGGVQLSRIGGLLARCGVVRACLALLTGGAPGAPRQFVRIFGPMAAHTLERLVGEVRKLPPEVHPLVKAHWCQPKCFRALADHLAALEETCACVEAVESLPDVPLVVVSSGDQAPAIVLLHQQLARLSPRGRHVVAAGAGHWIQLDDPQFVAGIVEEVVAAARPTPRT
jgi:pimeloyl-ACP methyl ester carboxylesterase